MNLVQPAILLFASVALTACRSPLTPPEGYTDVPDVRIDVLPDSRASVGDVRIYRRDEDILVLGLVNNETMLAFRGGRVEVRLLDANERTKATGSGPIQSLQVGPGGRASFRVSIEYGGPFAICRVIPHPDVEGR